MISNINEKQILNWKNQKDIKSLIEALNTKNENLKLSVINAIDELKAFQAIPDLFKQVEQNYSNHNIVKSAFNSIENIGNKNVINKYSDFLSFNQKFLTDTAKQVIIKNYNKEISKHLIDKFYTIDLENANKEDVNYINNTIQIFGQTLDENSIEAIVTVLPLKETRNTCLEIVSKFRSNKSVNPLQNILKTNKDNELRREIIKILGDFKDSNAIDALIELLIEDADMRVYIVRAFLKSNTDEIIKKLIKKFNEVEIKKRYNIALTLRELAWKPQKDLFAGKYYATLLNYTKCIELGQLAVPALIEVIENFGIKNSIKAIETLNKIGGNEAQTFLNQSINEISELQSNSDTAIFTVADLKDQKAVEPLKKILNENITKPNFDEKYILDTIKHLAKLNCRNYVIETIYEKFYISIISNSKLITQINKALKFKPVTDKHKLMICLYSKNFGNSYKYAKYDISLYISYLAVLVKASQDTGIEKSSIFDLTEYTNLNSKKNIDTYTKIYLNSTNYIVKALRRLNKSSIQTQLIKELDSADCNRKKIAAEIIFEFADDSITKALVKFLTDIEIYAKIKKTLLKINSYDAKQAITEFENLLK